MSTSETEAAARPRREDFVIVSTKFLAALSSSDLSPSELSLLCFLLARIRLGGNVVPNYSGIGSAGAIGAHASTVSTALTRLEERKIISRNRADGHMEIVINPHLASRADKRSRALLRAASRMPQVAITRLSRGRDQ